MYPGMDSRMDLCIQVWIIGCIYGSMYPGMDYRMDLWIFVSRYEFQDGSMDPYVSRYGLQDEPMDLCIQVWITGWIYGSMYSGMDAMM